MISEETKEAFWWISEAREIKSKVSQKRNGGRRRMLTLIRNLGRIGCLWRIA
jgi:hypothetical protein